MWLNQSLQYKHLALESVKKLETQLEKDLNELKSEIEINELVHGIRLKKSSSSVQAPKDAKSLTLERKLYIERLLHVHDTRPPYIQADVFKEQIENASKYEYKLDTLPLLLHQFYINRINWCVQAKHAHLLRWKRFSQYTNVIEELYPDFKNRVGYILSEYNDSVQRSQRLSAARESMLTKGSCVNAILSMQTDDLEIYLRWLVSHFYSIKSFIQFMKLLEWFPYFINNLHNQEQLQSQLNQTNKQQSRLSKQIDESIKSSTNFSILASKQQFDDRKSLSEKNRYFSVIDKIYLESTNALQPTDDNLNAISYLFNEGEIPMLNNNIDYLFPKLRYFVNYYSIDYNLSRMQTSGDEMELFAAVNRRFRHLFAQQEHMKAFRVYDMVEIGNENWGTDSPIHALKKESNWIKFIQLVPHKDAIYEKSISRIRNKTRADELLVSHNAFLEVNNDDRVQYILRENASYAKYQPSIEAVSVTSNKTQFNSSIYWKKIFDSVQMREKKDDDDLILPGDLESSIAKVAKGISFGGRHLGKKTNEFNFMENLQKYGLDDSNTNDQNLTGVQGSYLSFLLLRHLRLRDLKRQALGILNYFRSIERTITIYDGGLSFEGESSFKRQSAQNHSKETSSGQNLGSHAYMYNTPKDFKLSEMEFMEFSEIDNHDDFYCTDENGYVHVQDQRGYYIMYDSAVTDLKKLEDELLLISSYFIEKYRETESINIKNSRLNTDKKRKSNFNSQDPDLISYSHQNVDRFAVLYDIWTNEVHYLEIKRKLLDCYYEAYQNVFDKFERRNLAQIITDLMYQRPRIDLDMSYFVNTYRIEISCLYKQSQIIRLLVDRMMNDMRELSTKLNGQVKFGLPYPIIEKHLISVNMNEAQLNNVYMLEFHPALGVISRIPEAIRYSIEDLVYKKNLQTTQERLLHEKYFYESLYEHYQCIDTPGYSYTQQIQKDLFNGMFVEDPLFMDEIAQNLLSELDETLKNKGTREQTELTVSTMARVLEMVTLRHRLITAAMESEFLSKIYIKQGNELGFEDYHLYMRYIQFDFAKYKDDAGKPPPPFVTELSMEDNKIDKYIPNYLYLAVQELEEGQIGRFSFKGKENIIQMTRPNGIENLQIILKMQIVHNNALIGSIMQTNACSLNKNLTIIPNNEINDELGTSKDVNDSSMKDSNTSKITSSNKTKPYSESFISIQMEKNPSRDLMLNTYLKEKEARALILSNPNEMEKLKRKIINEFINKFSKRVYQHSLRAQLIILYYSISKILESFPNTRANHFVFGDADEKRNLATLKDSKKIDHKLLDEYADELKSDPRTFKKRPRKLLSDDGKKVLNIWFIPHYLELLVLYKKLNDENSYKALRDSVRIISALNDILNLIYANACLSSGASSGSNTIGSNSQKRKTDFSSWENTGGIGSELNEIQHEMNSLDDPCDPEQVAQLLEARRATLILQYECAIKHSVRDVFLSNGNYAAYKSVTENMHFALRYLTDCTIGSYENVYLDLPEPLDSRDILCKTMYPWLSILSKNGPFITQYWQWYLIEPNLSLSLSGLKDVEKSIANGEILGIHLLLEDILMLFSEADEEIFRESQPLKPVENNDNDNEMSDEKDKKESKTNELKEGENDVVLVLHDSINPLNQFSLPLINYAKIKYFLITWKRLEVLKIDWARRKMMIENFTDAYIYSKYSETYKKEILLPVIRILARKADARDFLELNIDETGPVVLPKGVSELESKYKQISKLLEKLESSMINETTIRIQKELRLVLNERGREENVLSTDLWKKSAMKEEFTTNKPHMVENFISMFFKFAKSTETVGDTSYVIKEYDLKDCLNKLGIAVQEREKSNYEQYTMFYENLLRQKHQLLYSKEREIQSMKEALQHKTNEMDVEVKCQMTEACYDLLMEVTALRAKIQEMNENMINKENELREKIKEEFIDLITDLVNVNTRLKTQFDVYKETVFDNVKQLLSKCRTEAIELTTDLKKKFGSKIDELVLNQQIKQANLIANLQIEKNELKNILIKQRSLTHLKFNRISQKFNKELISLSENTSRVKTKAIEACLLADEKGILLNQEKFALQKQLKKLDIEYNNLKTKLDKEIQEKLLRDHEAQQRIKNEKNLQTAKQSNVDKIFEELETKDAELRSLYSTTEKTNKIQALQEAKIQREMTTLKKQLSQERNLKLDAFQKVDELQTQVFDLEDEITNIVQIRPQTSKDGNRTLRLTSANKNNNKFTSPFPKLNANNNVTLSITNGPNVLPQNNSYSNVNDTLQKAQRPKTMLPKANIKLRLNDNPLNNDSSFHEQVSKLKQIRLKSAVSQ